MTISGIYQVYTRNEDCNIAGIYQVNTRNEDCVVDVSSRCQLCSRRFRRSRAQLTCPLAGACGASGGCLRGEASKQAIRRERESLTASVLVPGQVVLAHNATH
jgi:hypothetical protein